MSKPLSRLTLQGQAEQAIRQMILTHRFTPGSHINVEDLCSDLKVSRTPVVKALKKLEKQGLVQHQQHRGYLMAEMTLSMAVQLYQVREILESEAGRWAARHIDDGALNRLEAILERQRAVVVDGDLLGYSRSDFEFHHEIYSATGNWILIELLNLIKSRARPLAVDISPLLGVLYQAHVEIFRALKAKDAEVAARLMGEHTASVRRLIVSKMSVTEADPDDGKGD